jgi:hypothetical protein
MPQKPSNDRDPARKAIAGGAPLAFLIMAGTGVGMMYGQPSIGLLAGMALGCAVATWIWWAGSRR